MATAPFRVGTKQLFLPNFSISFLRTSSLPANFARFHVPLWFSKLDLRDYLWHGYGVDVVGVRSYVKQQRVQQGSRREAETRPPPRRWHRPRARKFMTAELVRPFVWPREPENFDAWNQREQREAERSGREYQEREHGTMGDAIVDAKAREAMREQARELLGGEKAWAGPSAYGGMRDGRLRGR